MENKDAIFEDLFNKMKKVNRGLEKLEFYEFMYAMKNVNPAVGWDTVQEEPKKALLEKSKDPSFYRNVKVKPKKNGKTVLDQNVLHITRTLFKGLISGQYSTDWICEHFHFDIRGFFFLPKITYFTEKVIENLDGGPFVQFSKAQKEFEMYQGIGYGDFKEANKEIDSRFIDIIELLIEKIGTPLIIGIAGPTAAGKTEIVDRLKEHIKGLGKIVSTIEMDNFFTDREYREAHGIHSMGEEALHFELLKKSLMDLKQGRNTEIPQYGYIYETSSHDEKGRLKVGHSGIEVAPADVIFIEGNFPFLFEELLQYIGVKVVYLTSDDIRLKRKWKRDIDYLKKYDIFYFINRYFRTQYLKAVECYIPQLENCDIAVDTTEAALWVGPEMRHYL
ncbi:MAG: hypothetical protein K9L66_02665 [Spirochaetaceae bacterium]|nr:hypothetical protein [Spirochaetaceae bacterium]MCF7947327.1 hypothetical protein [Spirochaetia bacterium]MCF7950553.1 hypothetical protein [Spirochaetaceae bacterium]